MPENQEKTYISIDLKSFYASVECVERGLDPLSTNLVVADESRTEKTICLAITPPLKAYGISGRPRLFEVSAKISQINRERRRKTPGKMFSGSSVFPRELEKNAFLAADYIVAPPRMSLYIDYSAKIYGIYLNYIAPEDIHVYSVDEVFIDVTSYLKTYKKTPRQLAAMLIKEVFKETGITAAAGIGTNLYLTKVAMDILAKRIPADKEGIRAARLTETSYRMLMWGHKPITDFWRVGRGTAKRLEEYGMYTMGDVARKSLDDQKLLYRLFGVNAQLLIEHAWGIEPCTIADIKSYKPHKNSISRGQVLSEPYPFEKARVIISEMADELSLELTKKDALTDKLVLTIGYDAENVSDNTDEDEYTFDIYGRAVPKHSRGTAALKETTSSARVLKEAAKKLFDDIANRSYTIRRINISAEIALNDDRGVQPDLFSEGERPEIAERERNMQKALLKIREKYGKNAVIKAMDLQDGATALSRNSQIGGHKA